MKRRTFVFGLVSAGLGLALAWSAPAHAQGRADPPGFARALAIQEARTGGLLAIEGVVGTGVGVDARGEAAVVVMTEDLGVRGLPRQLDGVPVVVMVTGRLQAVHHREGHSGGPGGGGDDGGSEDPDPAIDPTSRFDRPVPIGVSTGNVNSCSAGTIGARVTDQDGNAYALSNNHVYALENNPGSGFIAQPGRFDTGCDLVAGNEIGTLADFVPIHFDGSDNLVDAAIAATTTELLGTATPADGYGAPGSEPVLATGILVGTAVKKYGRTTGLTTGTVAAVNAIVNVGYSSGTARFVDQIVVDGNKGGFLNSGDSGSLLVLQSGNAPVGLLFASGRGGKIAIANEIEAVLGAFGVDIDDGS